MNLYDMYKECLKTMNEEVPEYVSNDSIDKEHSCNQFPQSQEKNLNRIYGNHLIGDIKKEFSIEIEISNHALFWNMCDKVLGISNRMRVFSVTLSGNIFDITESEIEDNLDDWLNNKTIIGFFDSNNNTFIGCFILSDLINKSDIDSAYYVSLSGIQLFVRRTVLPNAIELLLWDEFNRLKNGKEPTVSDYLDHRPDSSLSLNHMDLEALFFLLMDSNLPSVHDLLRIYPFESREDYLAIMYSALSPAMVRQLNFDKDRIIEKCTSCWESVLSEESRDKYASILNNVLDDLRECSPRKSDREIRENDFYMDASHDCICDVCGDVIKKGDKAYYRTSPAFAIRHHNCNVKVRCIHEYAQIDYLIKEIEFFERTFVEKENCEYYLDGSLTHSIFRKSNYITDRSKAVVRLPHFSEFVMDFISGESDYNLIKKYRPYHVYLEFLFKMKGLSNEELDKMGGYKYLMREAIGRRYNPDLSKKLDNIYQSELFWDEYTFSIVDSSVKIVIYKVMIDKIFSKLGIVHDDCTFILNGEIKTYSINSIDDSDLSITIDQDGMYCTDSVSSMPFTDYFKITDDVRQMIDYIISFEAK